MSEDGVDLPGLFRQRLAENRMDVRTGVKIAGPADALGAGLRRTHVVTELGVIERQFHKTDEGNRTRGGNLGGYSGNEFRMPDRHREVRFSADKAHQ